MSEKKANSIYKVHKVVEDSIQSIHVFYYEDHIDEIFERDPGNELFKKIFSEEELATIHNGRISVIFCKQQIHFDDSIGTIKLKIQLAFSNAFSLDELYLFCKQEQELNPVNIYQTLTQNGRLDLTHIRLQQFLSNIVTDELDSFDIPEKDIYTYDDILALNIVDRVFQVKKVLGQKFFIIENEYPFIVNPYQVTDYDEFIERAARKSVTTLNSHLLLNMGPISNNTITICLAEDVLDYTDRNGISDRYTLSIYFPFLMKQGISSSGEYADKIDALRDKDGNKEDLDEIFQKINLFYDLYQGRTSELSYKERGITSIRFIMFPVYKMKIPLDIIFKLIHATEDNPLIKFNPTTRQENLYRLFTNGQVSKDGRKIPVLDKSDIFKLMRNTGKVKSVAIYILHEEHSFVCEFNELGEIMISSKFEKKLSVEEITRLIGSGVNPIIQQVKQFLEESGYTISLFESLNNERIEVKDIEYHTVVEIDRPFRIKTIQACVSSCFIIESKDIKRGVEMRFKRVANFNKKNSREAFVIEKQKQGMRGEEIIEILMENYEMTESDATQLLSKMASELQVEHGSRRSSIEIKVNPGFKVTITLNKLTNNIAVQTEGIDNIHYLDTLPIYIDSLIRLTQVDDEGRISSKIPLDRVTTLCKGRESVEDITVEDIIAESEKGFLEQKIPFIEGAELEFLDMDEYLDNQAFEENEDKQKTALDLFFSDDESEDAEGEDEGEETRDSLAGGKSSPDSLVEGDIIGLDSLSNSPESEAEESNKEEKSSQPASDKSSLNDNNIVNFDDFLSEEEKTNTTPEEEKEEEEKEKEDSSLGSIVGIDSLSSSEKEDDKKSSSLGPIVGIDTVSSSEEKKEEEEEKKEEEEKEAGEEDISLSKSPSSSNNNSLVSLSKEEDPYVPLSDEALEQEIKKADLLILEKEKEEKKEEEEAKSLSSLEKPVQLVIEEKAKAKPIAQVEKLEKNIDGMNLANPYHFFQKMYDKDPVLFLTKQSGNYNAYSRSCASNMRRQPVILTEEEKQRIDSEKPGFLKESDYVKYGSNPDNQYYYTCPRYWCLKTNMPLTAEEAKSGVCGGIIPENASTVPKGSYVYEFFKGAEHISRDNYKTHYPGFLKDGTHPDGLCIPCCFKNWNTPSQIERRRQCANMSNKKDKPVTSVLNAEQKEEAKEEAKEETKEETKEQAKEETKEEAKEETKEEAKEEKEEIPVSLVPKKQVVEKDEYYIMAPEKLPITQNRWGYLPMAIQLFFNEASSLCQVSNTNTNIKPHYTCLLRHGVEINETQSFIGCIADVKFYGQTVVPSIKKMKEIIIQAMNLDNFITYQNGNLVDEFAPKDNKKKHTVDPNKYKKTNLYSVIKKDDKNGEKYFKKVISSYENFCAFLQDDTEIIDHTYLWDIVCKPNEKLFKSGLNLIILHITNNDTTNNIELICPVNHYSSEYYDSKKKTLFVIKNNNYYEPIYSYRNEESKIIVKTTFSELSPDLSKTAMHSIFTKIIKPILRNTCLPLASMPNTYKFKQAILLDTLLAKLKELGYTIHQQIVNYHSQVIGLITENHNNKGFVPCHPSGMKQGIPYIFQDTIETLFSYNETLSFLMGLHKESKGKIPCIPSFKVTEDEHVVGFLTATNQFVQISEPVALLDLPEDNIPIIQDHNYIVNKELADSEIALSEDVDNERIEYLKKIKLETNFYNVFRNTIRILLNKYENLEIRERIEKMTAQKVISYHSKLKSVITMLKSLVQDSIIFGEYDISLIDKVSTCIVYNGDEGKCAKRAPLCLATADNTCQIVIPDKNLLTGKNNELIYFGKMADELIRYNRIKSVIFKPQTFLSFQSMGYNLLDDEVILLQSLLNQEYFEGLEPIILNKYKVATSRDMVDPIITQGYDNLLHVGKHNTIKEYGVPADQNRHLSLTETKCQGQKTDRIVSGIWKKLFPSTFRELSYENSILCGFSLLIDIIHYSKNITLSIEELKHILYEEYQPLLESQKEAIMDILILEGKKTIGNQVKKGKLGFDEFLYSEDYFITPLDIWLIVTKYTIPAILLSSVTILQTSNQETEFLLHGEPDDSFIFIVSPGLRSENIPKYKIITNESNDISFPLTILKEGSAIRSAFDKQVTIETYLQQYKIEPKTKYKKKKYTLVLPKDEIERERIEQEDVPVEEAPLAEEVPLVEEEQKKAEEQIFIRVKKSKKNRNTKPALKVVR